MNKFYLVGIMLSASLGAGADSASMQFRTADGATHYIAIEDLNITFVDGQMMASAGESSLTLPLASLVSMEFSDVDAGVDEVFGATAAEVTVYSIDGICRGRFASAEASVAALESGVYVVKCDNGETSKIVIRK